MPVRTTTLLALPLLGFLLLAGSARADKPTPTPTGVAIALPGQDDLRVELAVGSNASFRVSLANGGAPYGAMDNPMIAPKPDAGSYPKFKVTQNGPSVTLATTFGSISFDADSLALQLRDTSGDVVASTSKFFVTLPGQAPTPVPSPHRASAGTNSRGDSTTTPINCTDIFPGYDVAAGERTPSAPDGLEVNGATECCNACGSDPDCTTFVFATDAAAGNKNCWPLLNVPALKSASNRVVGGPNCPRPKPTSCSVSLPNTDVETGDNVPSHPDGLNVAQQSDCCAACDGDKDCNTWVWATDGGFQGKNCWLLSSITGIKTATSRVTGGSVPPGPAILQLDADPTAKYYGAGGGGDSVKSLLFTEANAQVTNTKFLVPHYYSSQGYAALVVSAQPFASDSLFSYPVSWTSGSGRVEWRAEGTGVDGQVQLDVYLMPAADNRAALDALWDLSGRPALPPRYALGFLACRWGWKDDKYIWDTLNQFRTGSFPIDAWISDFEWFTPRPDYSLPEQGDPNYHDFSYNNVTFPDPVNQLKAYHDQLHLRFGGIRKPRLGNSDLISMAVAKGWSVDASHAGGAPGGKRNLNYSIAEVREWYHEQQAHYHSDGVDFFWNDEGETFYFAFYWWNIAQAAGLAAYDPKKRFWTINRSFSLGMQRIAATTWTGDIPVSWDSLQNQPGYVLNWALAGSGYVTCDTGGFNGGNDTPLLLARWYQMAAFMPIMRVHSTLQDQPHFPFLYGDEAAASMRSSLEIRYQLLPYHYSLAHAMARPGGAPIFRPVLFEFGDDTTAQDLTSEWMDGPSLLVAPVMSQDNSTAVYLPGATWFEFNSSTSHSGPTNLQLNGVPLDHIPMYVRAGSIIPMAPVLQYTDALPGGALRVHIYPGKDSKFTMIEDDGESTGYVSGATRETHFTWSDATKTLSWTVDDNFSDSRIFLEVVATAFFPSGSQESAQKTLGSSGTLAFK